MQEEEGKEEKREGRVNGEMEKVGVHRKKGFRLLLRCGSTLRRHHLPGCAMLPGR